MDYQYLKRKKYSMGFYIKYKKGLCAGEIFISPLKNTLVFKYYRDIKMESREMGIKCN